MDTSTLEAVGEHPLIGALINDRYVVDSVIGKGSSGIVYKATRLLMGREVAVKVLHSYLGAEAGALDRFLREARAASRLRHPHIINIWESGVTDDAQPYFVMDYLEGMTLADLVRQKGYLHAARAMPIITQICEALSEAHRQNIIHRDIKPENIVLETNEGDNNFDDYVKVLDFGIADAPSGTSGVPKQKTAAGSPAYMSPEQCQGFELDQRSDIYSLAIVIFEMLTGMRPFAADDVMKLFYMHVSQPPPTLSSMRSDLRFPMQVELAIAKALAKNPDNRQQSIKEFQKELEDAFASSDMGSGKRESVTVDLFSVPVVDRLMDGGGGSTSTGSHNFLPGPEDWEEPSEEAVMPSTPAAAPAAKSDSSDVSAAVNRLLKSAKRASEAVKQEDVGTWARDVLTRHEEQGGAKKDSPQPLKASGGQSPPENSGPEVSNWAHKVLSRQNTGEMNVPGNNQAGGAAKAPAQASPNASPANSSPQPGAASKPALSAASTPPAAKAPQPGQPNNPAARVPTGPGSAAPRPGLGSSASEAQSMQTKQGNKIAKPIELLKAKSAAEAARRGSGELPKDVAEESGAAIPLSLKAAEQFQSNSAGSGMPSDSVARPLAKQAGSLESDLDSLLDGVKPGAAKPVSTSSSAPVARADASRPAPPVTPGSGAAPKSSAPPQAAGAQARPGAPAGAAPASPTAAGLKPGGAATSPARPAVPGANTARPGQPPTASAQRLPGQPGAPAQAKPAASLPNAPQAKPNMSLPNAPQAKPSTSLPNAPQAKPSTSLPNAPQAKPSTSLPNAPQAKPSTSLPNAPQAKPSTSLPNAPQAKPSTSLPNAAQSRPSTSLPNLPAQTSAATPIAPTPVQPAGNSETVSSERPAFDPSRFEQPVNRPAESLNPFAQAIDGLLDAAIMPKTQEDVRRSANKLKQMEAPPGNAPDPLDPSRFELPINSRASFDPSRFENPINREALADAAAADNSRFDQPVNKGFISGSAAGSKMLGASESEKKTIEPAASTSLDVNRFEHPINRAEESLNPFAQAVDGLLDSARIKPEPKPVTATPSDLGQTAAAVGKPPDAAAIEALDSTAEEDRVHDAVSRLIEAAKRSPEPTQKPEVLNKKIEAVKKKIEALKAADVAKPISTGLPPEAVPPAPVPSAPTPTPAPFVPGPTDSNSLSDAVNRLLEAAQRQETTTNAPALPPQMVNPFADAYSSPAPPTPPSAPAPTPSVYGGTSPSTASSSSLTNVPASNPFDAAASTSMVNPFAQVAPPDPRTSGSFMPSANVPGPAAPDPNKKPPEGSAFQNYVSAPTDRMTRAAELINNAIKSSKTPEVAQDYYSGFKNDPKQIQAERAETLKKSRARVRRNFQGPPKPPLWVALILACLVGGFALWYGGFLPFFGPPKSSAPLSLDAYIKQGKYEKARELLEAKKKAGNLSAAEIEKMNTVYYQLGLKEGKEENYQDAVKDLKMVSRKSDLYPSAAAKIREFKKKMSDL